jgi:multiple antibiotic resistance protein
MLKALLGDRGLIACEKLMGLLLTLIAVQMFLEGTATFLHDMHTVHPTLP